MTPSDLRCTARGLAKNGELVVDSALSPRASTQPDGVKLRLEVLGLSLFDSWLDHFDGHPLRIFVAAWVGVETLIMLVSFLT